MVLEICRPEANPRVSALKAWLQSLCSRKCYIPTSQINKIKFLKPKLYALDVFLFKILQQHSTALGLKPTFLNLEHKALSTYLYPKLTPAVDFLLCFNSLGFFQHSKEVFELDTLSF